MKNLKAQYIFGTSVLLLLGAGCSFSLDTKPEEKVAPMVYTPQLIAENETTSDIEQAKTLCTDLGGETITTQFGGQSNKIVTCKLKNQTCSQEQLLGHICFIQKEKVELAEVSVQEGVLYNFSFPRGTVDGKKLHVTLDQNTIEATFESDPKNIAFWNGVFGDSSDSNVYHQRFDHFFKIKDKYLEIATKFEGPYSYGVSQSKFQCDGPFVKDSAYFYCETNKKDFLSQYEFNGTGAFIGSTGGDFLKDWRKIYVRQVGDKQIFFLLHLKGEFLSTDEAKDKKNAVGLQIASKEYLDSILKDPENKKRITEADKFIQSIQFRLLNTQDVLSYLLPVGFSLSSSTDKGFLSLQAQKEVKDHYGKIEVFSMADFGDRPFGFEDGNMSEEDQIRYIPAEQREVEIDGVTFDVWLWYKKGDTQTKAELDSIVKSLKWK